MKRKISAMVLTIVMILSMVLQPVSIQASGTQKYQVTLPDGYDENHAYPVIYVMPQDGKTADDSGITEKLQNAMKSGKSTSAIIVRPQFTEDDDIYAVMKEIVAEVDGSYHTIPDAEHRAIVGTGTGGYLAYILGITEEIVESDSETIEEQAEEEITAETEENPDSETAEEAEDTEEAENPEVEETTEIAEQPETAADQEMPEDLEKSEEGQNDQEEELQIEEQQEEEQQEDETVQEAVEKESTVFTLESQEESEKDAKQIQAKNITTLSAPGLFKYIASTRGDFVSEANPWYQIYGDVYDCLNAMGKNTVSKFYTYMDAPVTDTWTNQQGSSNDIGALFINFGTGSAAHEFTVRSGSFTDEFLTEAVNRMADRITSGMLSGVVKGSVSLTKAALPSTEKTAEVNYSVTMQELYGTFSKTEEDMKLTISVLNADGKVLAETSVDQKAKAGETVSGKVMIENAVEGTSSTVQLTAEILGVDMVVATTALTRIQDTVIEGDHQYIDLMGDWYFKYMGQQKAPARIDLSKLTPEEYETWSVVQPGLAWWTKGFGNISDENVKSPWGPDYFDYMIYGDGYYVRTFDVPENFDAKELVLSIGYMDDRGEVFINGQRVGGTGMNEDGTPTGDSTWAIYSYYTIDPEVLNIGGSNTIVVRCQNDGVGGGGWYAGPIALYSKEAFENDDSAASLFEEKSFESSFAASAQGKEGTVDNKYLVYLPDGYYESDKYYPTVYMMHQYNSDHTSYIIDGVDDLIDEAIKAALIDEMIVVVPNSSENSWWRGDWMKMVTDELVPLIDENYRTIKDARYRFTAGCSMGGQGAFGVALTNPDLFSGAISFFGAFSMGGDANPCVIAQNESEDYLRYYSMYFICGNQDVYGFGEPAIQLNQILQSKGVEHEFFIENGGHDSVFYLPYFIESMVYTRNHMYQSSEEIEKLLTGNVIADISDGIKLKVTFEAKSGIEEYYNVIPASSYTKNSNPDLSVPLTIEVVQDGKVVFRNVERNQTINNGNTSEIFQYDLSSCVDSNKEFTVIYKASVFDRVVELEQVTFNTSTEEPASEVTPTPEVKPTQSPAAGSTITSVTATTTSSTTGAKTGDDSPIGLYATITMACLIMAGICFRRRKRA